MDPNMSFFFMFTISFPEAAMVSYFVIQFMGKKPKLPQVILIGLVQAVISYIVRTLPIPVGLHTILLLITIIFLISLISRISFWAASIGAIIGVMGIMLIETIISQLVIHITGQSLETLVIDNYKRLLFDIPTLIAVFIIIILINVLDINFEKMIRWQYVRDKYQVDSEIVNNNLYKEYLPAVVFIFLPILILGILNFTYVSVHINDSKGYYPRFFKFLFNTLIIMLALMSLWAVQRLRKSIEKEAEATKAAETIKQMKELILSIRKQRHDFNHQLQTVYGLMDTGNFNEALGYIENTYRGVSVTGELIKTDNPGISALLYAKIGIAEARNIKFDININCSLERLPLNANEASSLLGNLIDNAFDAVENLEVSERALRLDIEAERGNYILEVTNRGELDPGFAERIFHPSFTTKEGHSGLGLVIVKEIVDKYRGSIEVLSGAGDTVFRVNIPFRR